MKEIVGLLVLYETVRKIIQDPTTLCQATVKKYRTSSTISYIPITA
jgi:hypothetical protein